MTIFDLVFILCFFAMIIALSAAVFFALQGQPERPRRILRRLGVAVAIYACILVLTSAFSAQQFAAIGARQCSDDWCLTVSGARTQPLGATTAVNVDFRIESRAGRVDQREGAVAVFLRDAAGNRYAPVADPAAVPFDTLIHPGQVIDTSRRFVLPSGTPIAGIVIAREGIPECCIIGDEGSFFHRQTIVRLE